MKKEITMITDAQILEAIQKKCGNISEAARNLKIARINLYKRINAKPELQQALIEAREVLLDITESEALRQIKQGNTAMIIFTLKTLGRNRGYVERSEIEHRMRDVSQLSDEELQAIAEGKSGS